ncbi:MAG: hypothetical protein Kow00108_23460 [Calditrichia bacterium]
MFINISNEMHQGSEIKRQLINIRRSVQVVIYFSFFLIGNLYSQAQNELNSEMVFFNLIEEWKYLRSSQHQPDSSDDIQQTIQFFVDNKLWENGIIFIESLISEKADWATNNDINNMAGITEHVENNRIKTNLTLGTGFNFSEQNFEIQNFDSDSLITDQLSTPEGSVLFNLTYKQNLFRMNHTFYLSGDNQYYLIQNTSKLSLNSKKSPEIVIGYELYHNFGFSDFSYSQIRLGASSDFSVNEMVGKISFEGKRKKYAGSDSIAKSYHSLLLNQSLMNLNILGLSDLVMELYHNSKLNRDEFESYQYMSALFQSKWKELTWNVSPMIINNNYKTYLNTEVLKNSFLDIGVGIDLKFPLIYTISIKEEFETFRRQFAKENAMETNYIWYKNKIGPSWNSYSNLDLWISYLIEGENHYSTADSLDIDDFTTRGFGVNIQISRPSCSFFLDYEYRDKKTSAPLSDILSYNQPSSNHNILMSFYFPITRNWTFSVSVNYSHDKNLREKNVTSFNYMSGAISYTF